MCQLFLQMNNLAASLGACNARLAITLNYSRFSLIKKLNNPLFSKFLSTD